MPTSALIDQFNRAITYVRLSVTDRCDFRCVYCMAEKMTFKPRNELLTLEEIGTVGQAFSELGVNKIRITGGEPLVRNNIMHVFKQLGRLPTVNDLTLTTNGSRLHDVAHQLVEHGVKRVNVSLDSLDKDAFKRITRVGNLDTVLTGLQTAKKAGLHIKLNSVILRHQNLNQVKPLCDYAMDNGFDISFIEEMPLGDVTSHSRANEFISSEELRDYLSGFYTLTPSTHTTHGPSKYWSAAHSDTRMGFISPHSHNFCEQCNRVRVTATGQLLLCLGNEHSVDLKHVLRNTQHPLDALKHTIVQAMAIKPLKHDFNLQDKPDIVRFMNTTGG